MRANLWTALLGCAAVFLVACGNVAPAAGGAASAPRPAGTPAKPGTVPFGVAVPLTGFGAPIGASMMQGANLAVQEINAHGGVDGWKLKAMAVDNKGTAQGGIQAMNQLVGIDKVPYSMVTFSSAILASQPFGAQNHVLMINNGGPSDSLLNKSWLYNTQVMPNTMDPALARYIHSLGYTRVAMITRQDASGRDNATQFRKAWKALGGTIVDAETFPVAASDFTPQLTKILSAHPQAVYTYESGDNLGVLVKQARGVGITVPLYGLLASPGALLRIAGKAAEGFVNVSLAINPSSTDPAVRAYFQAYRAKYHRQSSWIPAISYEAVQILGALVGRVVQQHGNPLSGTALKAALKAKPDFHNYLEGGTVRILPDHGASRALSIQEVENGRFVVVKTVTPSS